MILRFTEVGLFSYSSFLYIQPQNTADTQQSPQRVEETRICLTLHSSQRLPWVLIVGTMALLITSRTKRFERTALCQFSSPTSKLVTLGGLSSPLSKVGTREEQTWLQLRQNDIKTTPCNSRCWSHTTRRPNPFLNPGGLQRTSTRAKQYKCHVS